MIFALLLQGIDGLYLYDVEIFIGIIGLIITIVGLFVPDKNSK